VKTFLAAETHPGTLLKSLQRSSDSLSHGSMSKYNYFKEF